MRTLDAMLNRFSSLRARLPKWTPPQWVLAVVLAVIVFAAIEYLIFGPKPWDDGIEAAEKAGRKVKAHHFSITSLYWTTWLSLGVSGLLLICVPWLAKPLSERFVPETSWPRAVPWRWIGISTLGAVILTSYFTWPRLGYSLWFDEEFMLRKQVVADYLRRDERKRMSLLADLERREPSWRETLWFYEMPNNHPPVAIMARFLEKMAAQPLTPDRPDGYYFSEKAYRFPSWIAGMLSLPALAVMLALLGSWRAALVLPWFLSLHPWFLRYASEARGYVFLFLFGPLCVIALVQALRTGRWRWWAAFGGSEFLYLWFNASGVWMLILLNLGTVICLLTGRGISAEESDRFTLLRRWFVSNTLAALAFIEVMAPCYLQLKRAFHPHPLIAEILGPKMMIEMLSELSSGMRWFPWGEEDHPFAFSLSDTLREHPFATVPILGLLVFYLVIGCAWLWRQGGIHRWIAIAFVFSAPAFYANAYVKGLQLYVWYVIYVLPLLWALVALGLDSAARGLEKKLHLKPGVALMVLMTVLLAGFGFMTDEQRLAVRNHPVEQERESVELTRKVVNPYAVGFDEVITVGFNKYTRAYDPGFYQARCYEDFLVLLKKADDEGKPLYVNYAMPGFARNVFPEIMEVVDDPTKFEHVATLHGLEPTSSRFVRKYIPKSVPQG